MGATNLQLGRLAGVEIFSVDGAPFTWGDAVLAGLAGGEWSRLEAGTRQGIAAGQRLTASGAELSHDDVVDAAKRFRYARELLAGEQLDAWLDRWAISVAEWRDYLRRDLLRARTGGGVAATDVSAAAVDSAIGVEAICSGVLEQLKLRLALECALAGAEHLPEALPAVPEAGAIAGLLGISEARCTERLELVARIAVAAAAARTQIVGAGAVEHELSEHRLDWLQIEVDVLELEALDAAREALLCVRNDGRRLADVAAEAGTATEKLHVTLADAPEWLAPHLLGVEGGSLVGPVAHGDSFKVVSVASKREPSAADGEIRTRAEAALVDRAARRAIGSRVQWHEPDVGT